MRQGGWAGAGWRRFCSLPHPSARPVQPKGLRSPQFRFPAGSRRTPVASPQRRNTIGHQMTALFRRLSVFSFIAALLGIAALLLFDTLNHLRFTPVHQRLGALSLMLIGFSYIMLQLSARRRWNEMLKGVLLGTAFLLWGCEQLLPPSPLVTAMDSAVVAIFVVDLSLIILEHLRRRDQGAP